MAFADKVIFKTLDSNLKEESTHELVNPFEKCSEMLNYFKWLATKAPLNELIGFARSDISIGSSHSYGSPYFRFSAFYLQFCRDEKKGWWDEQVAELIRCDNFFDDCYYDGAHHNIDFYVIGKCELRVLKEIPEHSQDIQYIWLVEDLIEIYYNLGTEMKGVVAEAYKTMGWQWFAYNAKTDPIMFRWALLGLLAAKTLGKEEQRLKVKTDLLDIYENMIIAFGVRCEKPFVAEIIKEIKGSLISFDDDKIQRLYFELKGIKDEKIILKQDKRKLEECLLELKRQVFGIQNKEFVDFVDEEIDVNRRVNDIIERVSCFSIISNVPFTSYKFLNSVNRIWNTLSYETQKDIQSSVKMLDLSIGFDIALLPLLRSLEREFSYHVFMPFKGCRDFYSIRRFDVKNETYKKEHEALQMKNNTYPTLGTIQHFGTIDAQEAIESSDLIKLFCCFISPVLKDFKKICVDIKKLRIGTRKLRLSEIRNGIAHGKVEVTNQIDEKIYQEIATLLYDKPLEILIRLISISRKG
ncbi:hypothetical protein GTO91_13075 [Heliobacterium undosum]|uniref:Uncharacterized protein n=1 Tax=Heliomicrobium undosum TaxID=121734 RepID=A0A845L765_9FIRM|nr:hypothetical protein [Heliomicrobium undosum]MZP30644.1 hypothetical protein [Heliomicrobium undosum]